MVVSLPAVLDTLQALPLIDIFNSDEFKCLLQANLICHQQDIATFDKLFYEFWLAKARGARMSATKKNEKPRMDESPQSRSASNKNRLRPPEEEEPAAEQQWSIRYSPDSLNKLVATKRIRFAESRAIYETICKLLQPLNKGTSRRLRYTNRGKQISLRRILRKNMQFGGELIFLDRSIPRIRTIRFIRFYHSHIPHTIVGRGLGRRYTHRPLPANL